jgi:hypothetical protein
MNQNKSHTISLDHYKAALIRPLVAEDGVLWRPQGENGGELVLYLSQAPNLQMLLQLAAYKGQNRVDLIQQALAQPFGLSFARLRRRQRKKRPA